MNDTSFVTPESANDFSFFTEVLTWYDQTETIKGLLTFLACVGVFVICLIMFRKKINGISKNQISAFVKVKKYIPSLYVELNDNMEQVRYFMFSYRWKRRIIKKYNLMFKGFVGKQLKQGYKKEIRYRISYFSSFSTVKDTIVKTNKVLNEFRKERKPKREDLGEFSYIIENLSYDCINTTENLLSLCQKIECKNMIVVGSAGNGKTSLLCRATEMAIKNKYPCLMLNSKDIDNSDVIEYILRNLPLIWKVKNYPLWFLRVVNFILFIRRKYLFIVIDAINENDSRAFMDSIGKVNDFFNRFSRVKVLLSCRSEYFDCRYQKLFDESETKPYVFKLNTTDYDERAVCKFFVKYSNYYNVTRMFSENVQNNINKSLLLMRIFFEVNSNRSHENLEFQNAEIYKQYVDKLALEHPDIDVKEIISKISSIMVNEECYDKVEISKLNLSSLEKKLLWGLLDDNLLISKTIKSGKGIAERSTEYLYFIFDEFRDFCIARELIVRDEKNADHKYCCFFSSVEKMSVSTQAPLEGVLKYGYYHFKKSGRTELIEILLNSFGTSKIQQINRFSRNNREKTYYFDDFGLSLIFMNGESLFQVEKSYLYNSLKNKVHNNLQFFFFLLNNEIVKEKPDLDKYLEIVFNETESIILSNLVAELMAQEPYGDSTKLIHEVYYKVNVAFSRDRKVSDNIKKVLILILSLDISEWYVLPSGERIEFDDSEFDYIISMVKCADLQENVKALKEYMKEQRKRNKRYNKKFVDF